MLKLLGFLSIKLQPLRKISILLSVILLAIIVTQLLGPSSYPKTNTTFELFSFVTLIWLLLFNLLLSLFQSIPSIDKERDRILARIKIKVQRSLYQLLAVFFVGLTLVIIFLSVRMLRI